MLLNKVHPINAVLIIKRGVVRLCNERLLAVVGDFLTIGIPEALSGLSL